jgi:hypothetical protein
MGLPDSFAVPKLQLPTMRSCFTDTAHCGLFLVAGYRMPGLQAKRQRRPIAGEGNVSDRQGVIP